MRKILAVSGILGPLIYVTVIFVLGFLTPGYDNITQYMSELGAVGAPYAVFMNTFGFMLVGLLLILFTIGFHDGIKKTAKIDAIGPALMLVSGISLFLLGIFTCDTGCANFSIMGNIHSYFARLSAASMILATILIAPRIKRDNHWSRYWKFSVLTGVVSLLFSALFIFTVFSAWAGFVQRITVLMPLMWVEVMAARLFQSP